MILQLETLMNSQQLPFYELLQHIKRATAEHRSFRGEERRNGSNGNIQTNVERVFVVRSAGARTPLIRSARAPDFKFIVINQISGPEDGGATAGEPGRLHRPTPASETLALVDCCKLCAISRRFDALSPQSRRCHPPAFTSERAHGAACNRKVFSRPTPTSVSSGAFQTTERACAALAQRFHGKSSARERSQCPLANVD
ncbi:hypothetical protein EVAR_88983_1 [Eumeta japonica]|uniref:Uncharacterized protein n=1 Tax=Eumeta variegata TaxID=151549 RepID=A0A4C1VRA4_EUMVA|nr:hypothetical protein EVAR_88983_1 [Eumeta japonica]